MIDQLIDLLIDVFSYLKAMTLRSNTMPGNGLGPAVSGVNTK